MVKITAVVVSEVAVAVATMKMTMAMTMIYHSLCRADFELEEEKVFSTLVKAGP